MPDRDEDDVVPSLPPVRVPVRGGGRFPVHRIYCVGRNFADHAREMGATVAATAERGQPILFLKPADALVTDGRIPYPPGTAQLHHEVEPVLALGRDAPPGVLDAATAEGLVYGLAIGLDLTRRDLQSAAKAAGQPWDTAKAFDASAPISAIVPWPADTTPTGTIQLHVNGELRQQGRLDALLWSRSRS